jgi:glucose-6-phosphate 1-dehydrogenase
MNWRWSGVPFYLRTGKRMLADATEIVINFKALPIKLFSNNRNVEPNVLVVRIQPNEGIHLQFNNKKPGASMLLEQVNMDFCHSSAFGSNSPEAYERLLHDVLKGESTLFTRWDELEQSWKVIDPISRAWVRVDRPSKYLCGTWGPKEADLLLEKNGHRWNIPMSNSVCKVK